MKALLIIDMQNGNLQPYSNRHDTLGTIEKINLLSRKFRSKNYPIIFVQHDGTQENCLLPNSKDWQIIPELNVLPQDIIISKTANDSFYNTTLTGILNEKQISELYITGCATDFCVDSTVKSAHTRDYKVTVIADGHTTSSRPFADAQTIINHYNWLWADLSPTKYKIDVIKADLTE